MTIQYFCCLLLLTVASTEKVRYDSYQLVRLSMEDNVQLDAVNKIYAHSKWFTKWTSKKSVDLIIAPDQLDNLDDLVKEMGLKKKVLVHNMQKLIDEQQFKEKSTVFNWKQYHDIHEIHSWLDSLASQYPSIVETIVIGKSYEGRPLKGVKVSYKDNNPGIFLESGIHAAEWIGPATATWILSQLLTSANPDVRFIAESFDWYIFPSVNPDGYQYSFTTDRLWRKTRSPGNRTCVGADPNRNWDFHWSEQGADTDPCSNSYAGTKPFSEIETRTLAEYLRTLIGKIQVYLDFHSYGQLLMFPYSYSTQHVANYDTLMSFANKSAEALANWYGTMYTFGDIAETIYIASGSSMDWVYSNINVTVPFVWELRDTGTTGFILPPEQIIPTAQETLDSIITLLVESRDIVLKDLQRYNAV